MIQSGLASEIVLLSFLRPDSGYKFAQIIQDTEKPPEMRRINEVLKKLLAENYLRIENKKYYPNYEKLFSDIVLFFKEKEIVFSESEINYLKKIIKNNQFFLFCSVDAIIKIQNQPPHSHQINALEVICDKIGMMASMYNTAKQNSNVKSTNSVQRKSSEQIDNELESEVKKINEKMSGKIRGSRADKREKMKSIELLNATMKSFILFDVIFSKIPEETLKKMSEMWSQNIGFEMGFGLESLKNYSISDLQDHLSKMSRTS